MVIKQLNSSIWWGVCYCSFAKSFPTLQSHGLQHCQASLSFTLSQSLLKLMSIESIMGVLAPVKQLRKYASDTII